MKLLTLNTHSLMEQEYENKLEIFVQAILKHQPDIIALQEIMQPVDSSKSQYPCVNAGSISLKEGNHALNIVKRLDTLGTKYNLAWLVFKKSYGRFDEGVAIITPHKIEKTDVITLSPFDEYENWRTRKALGALINGEWFYSVHMGWWESTESPFRYELSSLLGKAPKDKCVWLMGDFNSVAAERDKGYDLILSSGLYDTYNLAVNKDEGITAKTDIDGWDKDKEAQEIRIDYIFVTENREIESSFVIFNGKNEPIISDHFGIIVTTGKEEK